MKVGSTTMFRVRALAMNPAKSEERFGINRCRQSEWARIEALERNKLILSTYVYTQLALPVSAISYRVADHFPLWVDD